MWLQGILISTALSDLSASRRMRKMWVAVYLWLSFQCFILSCLFLGLYLFSILCPVIYLLIFFSVLVSFCLFLIPSSDVVSVTFSVLPCSLPNPPPLLLKHLRVWQVREQQYSPGAPPLPFPHLFSPIFFHHCFCSLALTLIFHFHINRHFLYLHFILSTSSRFSPLFPFGFHLSLKPCFFFM